jgi:hypothetical protein
MTNRSDYTDDQWKKVTMGPTAAGMHVIQSDHGGSVKESFSMARSYTEVHKNPGASELLDVLANTQPKIDRTIGTPEEMSERNLQHIRDGVAIVKQKADARELQEYKDFIANVAKHVAEARKEGFLGLSGEVVSEKEQAALDQITEALG